jgi:hypothetical protein
MSQIKSLRNNEIDRVSFCKLTMTKKPEEYLSDILLFLKSRRTTDEYLVVFQNTTKITFEYKGVIG